MDALMAGEGAALGWADSHGDHLPCECRTCVLVCRVPVLK